MKMRKDMIPDTVYREQSTGMYAVTPDCVGVYWYDSLTEVIENYGEPDRIIYVDTIEPA